MDQRRIGEALPTLSVIDRLRLLRRVPLFAGLSPDDLKSLAEIASEETFGPGEVLAEQGEPGEELYVLVSGEVGVVLGLGAPGEREVARRGPGDHLGEMAVVGGGPRSASLVARTDVRALMVDRPHFESLLRERPEVSLSLMRALVERVQESTRLLPADLAARTEGGARPLPGSLQRRVVTMLFCDVVGSTGMAERLDPEEWGDIVDEAYALLVEPVERYGGTLARFMGDAILAFFGAPVAHEDDAERAVRAGLAMVKAVGPLRERLGAQGLPFDVRVGINTGLVRTGELGPDARVEYTALGDAVNVAARMEQSAAPGTVQISEPTSRKVAPLLELEDLGPIQVKGKLEPVRAYQVVGPKARPGRVHGIEGLVSPLVGRDREMAALRELAGAVRVGTGHVVSLVGEAGLGKSRMIDELRAEWVRPGAGDPARWVEARAISYEANRPYALVQQFLRQVGGLGERDDADAVRARVAAFVETIGPAEPARTRAVFELLLGVDPVSEDPDGEPPASRLPEGEDLKREVLAIASEACRAWAAGACGVVVGDDLHWSDPASLEFLLHLLPVAAEAPVLFVCACRPDPPDLPDRIAAACSADWHTPMPLAPLAADETAVLLAELLRMPDLPDELRHSVVDRAAGNPLFVEETLRALIDAGAVVRKDGRWRMVEQAQVTVPDHLQGLLAARVDRLEPGPRRTLQLAAVIGRSFGHRVLRLICDDPDDLGDHLDKLERAGLIVETAGVPDLEFGFRHPLLQEAAYGSMLIRERRAYHARVGEALEPDLADRDDRAATLAHHFDQAGDTERALRYRMAAARRAARLFAHTEAIAQFERALELARQSGTTGAELFDLYRRLGYSLQVSGQHERALRVFGDMEREARRLGERATELAAVTAQATIRAIPSEMQDPDLALGLLDRSVSLAADIGDRAAEARAHWNECS
jgi:class 3 adenylate cyclase